jgi:hypothetical protein
MTIRWQLAVLMVLALLASSLPLDAAQEDRRSRRGGSSSAEQGEKSGSPWFADPERGWIRSDERDRKRDRGRDKEESRREGRGRNKKDR